MLDYAGNVIEDYTYNAYGEEQQISINPQGDKTILYQWQKETDTTHNPFRYCGEYQDLSSGLIYLRNRYYDPSVRRFINEDTLWNTHNMIYGDNYDKDNPIPLMEAIYAMNNPIKWIDPSGFSVSVSGSPISDWNAYNNIKSEYKKSMNCYAYAMGMIVNPITGKKFNSFWNPRYLQPGMLVGKNKEEYYSGEQIVSLMKQDAQAAGMVFEDISSNPNADIPIGTYKIAVVRDTVTKDYHFYRQNADGSWSHKQGSTNVKNTDNKGNIIYDPRDVKNNYNEFVGFYYVGKPVKEEER